MTASLLSGPLVTALLVASTIAATAAEHGRPDMSACLHAADADERVAACTAIIDGTDDPRLLVRALTARGNALCASDDRCALAVPDFAAVAKMAPGVAGYQDNLARALRAARRFDEAGAASDRAIALAPQLAFTHFGKAKALEGAGHLREALGTLERAMALAPDNAGLWEYRGKLLGELRDFGAAHVALERALALQPDRASVYVTRAEVETAEGRRVVAMQDLQRYPADGRRADEVRASLQALRATEASRADTIASPTRDTVEQSAAGVTAQDSGRSASPTAVAQQATPAREIGPKRDVRGFVLGMTARDAIRVAQERQCHALKFCAINAPQFCNQPVRDFADMFEGMDHETNTSISDGRTYGCNAGGNVGVDFSLTPTTQQIYKLRTWVASNMNCDEIMAYTKLR